MVEPPHEHAVEHRVETSVGMPSIEGFAILRPASVIGRLSLRCRNELAVRIGADTGLDLSAPINRATTGTGISALRLGPDEWLLLAEAEADPWLGARIGTVAHGGEVAVIDVTHRTAGFVATGPKIVDVLASGCPLPLDLAAFPIGRATRTVFAKTEVVLWRRAADAFHIEVARSFVPYLAGVLGNAVRNEAAIAAARS